MDTAVLFEAFAPFAVATAWSFFVVGLALKVPGSVVTGYACDRKGDPLR